MEKIITLGLDLAKSVFQVHGIAGDGSVVVPPSLAVIAGA
jgi:transposase